MRAADRFVRMAETGQKMGIEKMAERAVTNVVNKAANRNKDLDVAAARGVGADFGKARIVRPRRGWRRASRPGRAGIAYVLPPEKPTMPSAVDESDAVAAARDDRSTAARSSRRRSSRSEGDVAVQRIVRESFICDSRIGENYAAICIVRPSAAHVLARIVGD